MADQPNTSRRRFITGAAVAIPAAGISLTAAVAAAPESDLIRLGRELRTAVTAQDDTFRVYRRDLSDKATALCDASWDRCSAIVEEIMKLSASTLAEVRVKAEAISWSHSGEPIEWDSFDPDPTTDLHLAATIVRDLLSMHAA